MHILIHTQINNDPMNPSHQPSGFFAFIPISEMHECESISHNTLLSLENDIINPSHFQEEKNKD